MCRVFTFIPGKNINSQLLGFEISVDNKKNKIKTVYVDRHFVLSLWNENSQICTAPHQVAS